MPKKTPKFESYQHSNFKIEVLSIFEILKVKKPTQDKHYVQVC